MHYTNQSPRVGINVPPPEQDFHTVLPHTNSGDLAGSAHCSPGQENSVKNFLRIPEDSSVTPRRENTRREVALSLTASQKTIDGPVMDIRSGI